MQQGLPGIHPMFPPSHPHRPHIKVCGITRAEDGLLALELGASFLGIILTTKSPRRVEPDAALALVAAIREQQPEARIFGVFVDEQPAEVASLVDELRLALAQIHGPVSAYLPVLGAARILPAVAVRSEAEADTVRQAAAGHPAVLVDSFSPTQHGGTGRVFDHLLVQPLFDARRIFVAGGLTPANISDVVERLGHGSLPYAFDISSGLEESPGIKSAEKMRAFFAAYGAAMDSRN
jgi:phosphoribosylanthranilate isomerase